MKMLEKDVKHVQSQSDIVLESFLLNLNTFLTISCVSSINFECFCSLGGLGALYSTSHILLMTVKTLPMLTVCVFLTF